MLYVVTRFDSVITGMSLIDWLCPDNCSTQHNTTLPNNSEDSGRAMLMKQEGTKKVKKSQYSDQQIRKTFNISLPRKYYTDWTILDIC